MELTHAIAKGIVAASPVFLRNFSGLAFETLPFLLIGSLLSSFISVFVPGETLKRLQTKRAWLGICAFSLIGAFLPVCECAIVPLARRLRGKGVRSSAALAFMLAAPIVNPITLLSTAAAFGPNSRMWLFRLCLGLCAALCVALAVEVLERHGALGPIDPEAGPRYRPLPSPMAAAGWGLHQPKRARAGIAQRLEASLLHASGEFFDSSRYVLLGILCAAGLKALVDPRAISRALALPGLALCGGGLSAFVLSLCSSADAFVARSLFYPQSPVAAMAFLVLGPMLDIKNLFMLSAFLKPRQLLGLSILIVIACLGACLAAGPLLRPGIV